MGNKNKQNGEARDTDSTLPKDEDVGAEGDETTDDEGGVDTPPPQKDEEEQEDAQNEDGTFEAEMRVVAVYGARLSCLHSGGHLHYSPPS
ncbi:hypothetical protein E2C01_102866 [Portunus trituberculatus]|uniref:Uncharacterized protein n=1 Tax=Portunus trituberculatus TaxID=210409 RepID=A0A5B7KQ54_PORTR|nr:hypothetical protein [Portunus trituberculatus]